MTGDTPILVGVRDLSLHFHSPRFWGGSRPPLAAVDGVSFDIRQGETLALVGESGSGKSTIARCLAGLYRPTSGRIEFAGEDIARLRGGARRERFSRRVQMVFQDPYSSLDPRWRIGRTIAEPIRAYGILRESRLVRRRVDELLRSVGLAPDDARRLPREFSGGQRQRIAIARALASDPAFLICDEPTSALDMSVQARILNLLRDLQDQLGLTMLFISHNIATILQMADRVAVMRGGRICELSEADALYRAPASAYTKLLLGSLPGLDILRDLQSGSCQSLETHT
jgi:peptide/nickel transport system ATP-binding protein